MPLCTIRSSLKNIYSPTLMPQELVACPTLTEDFEMASAIMNITPSSWSPLKELTAQRTKRQFSGWYPTDESFLSILGKKARFFLPYRSSGDANGMLVIEHFPVQFSWPHS